MSKAFTVIRKNLGGIPLLPTIGNNDVPVHNMVPCSLQEHQLYYSSLFDMYFPKGALPIGFNYNQAKDTFLKGGYYRYDFADSKFTLLSLNTMHFKNGNTCGK